MGIFQGYRKLARDIFRQVPLQEADVAVLPFSWKYTLHHPRLRSMAIRFAEDAAGAGKRVLIFFDSDSIEPVPLDNAIVFRTSAYRSKSGSQNEHGLPGWSCDLLHERLHGSPSIRPKREIPVIGFCGYAPPLALPFGKAKMKESLRWILASSGLGAHVGVQEAYYPRVEAIRSCLRTSGLLTNFVIRPRPGFSSTGDPWGTGGIDRRLVSSGEQHDFMSNVIESDYVLCSRGYGNYSYRLYEALSCGRIPIFIDTDCLLPFHDEADWRSVCVWVDRSDLSRTGERVREFHHRVSAASFEELQHAARRFWETWVAPHAFFGRIADEIARLRYSRAVKTGQGVSLISAASQRFGV